MEDLGRAVRRLRVGEFEQSAVGGSSVPGWSRTSNLWLRRQPKTAARESRNPLRQKQYTRFDGIRKLLYKVVNTGKELR